MTTPNIVATDYIAGGLSVHSLTLGSQLVTQNVSNSQNLIRINSVTACNKSSTATGVSLYVNVGGNNYYIAYELAVPANSSVVLVDKNSAVYLMENNYLYAEVTTGGGNTADFVISYDTISD